MNEYIVKTKVAKLEEKRMAVRSFDTGEKDDAGKKIFGVEYENCGWFVLFEGSNEYLYLGHDKPESEPGKEVKVGQPAEIRIVFK